MKRYNILSIIASLFLLIGCGKDVISYDEGAPSDPNVTEYGYLVLPDVVYVDLSSEEFNEIQSKATTTKASTTEAGDDYLVTITNTTLNTVAFDSTYGELKKLESLELTPSSYSIYMRSTDEIPGICDQAHYAGEENFVIVGGMTTTLDNLICTMTNIKVSLNMSADFLELFKEDSENTEENLNINLSIAENSVDYTRNDSGVATFFQAVETSNTLELVLSGMYNMAAANEDPNYTMIEEWKQSIEGVKAGQWRNISISVENTSAGTVSFIVTIDTWTYDEEVNVDITSSLFQLTLVEPELDDPENYITDVDAPVVTLGDDNGSLDQVFTVDPNSFSMNSSLQPICVDPLIINVATTDEATLSEMWIEFTSDNETFNTLLETKLGAKRRSYITPVDGTTDYYTIADNRFETTYEGMYYLYIYSGIHKATIMIKDSEGRTSYSSLVIVSSNDGAEVPTYSAPTIVWRGGVDFEERYVIDPVDGLEVILDITSETGITGFTLQINSDVLTPEELEGINLAQNMDLINPGDCEGGLSFLGFPVGNAVEGQKSLEFDITSFMPQLQALGAGDSDFVLNVTDLGGTTTKTIKVRVE